ncbi:tRNA (32-2'-O)-methyltransferase regulator THADA [Cydia pomonella]|uniref:tRNA (32-2'-O)-methyltransferase regulator THADA n=1 Tax=Cydia pomonella TaxID=82600 RepID=UPI002ADD905F|nr:tRNA (32-2'-O)-methyltransferase regulator THADA [Cydia pomonella]
MNELNLRVSGGIGEKVKKPAAPLSIPYWNTGVPSEFFNNFLNCNSADNQLKLLKQYLNSHRDEFDQETVTFIVLLFWHADAKHPIKGFLKKHITDSRTLRQPFTETLTSVIVSETEESPTLLYGDYIDTVTRLDTAIDKFPPGAEAVRCLEIAVSAYYVRCLETCVKTLELQNNAAGDSVGTEVKSEPLAPTEINKIYDLVHLTLRLLLYMIQKVTNDNTTKLSSMFERIRSIIFALMLGKEVPMDTKSVSGIIYLTLHLFEKEPGSWIAVLERDRSADNGTVNLSIYSAVATVVPPAELSVTKVNSQLAVLDLTEKILTIGDRYSSDPSHTLAVARTLLSISRSLSAGAALAALLARWCWAHAEHHMDSVRHLAAQLMARVVAAAVQLEKEVEVEALAALLARWCWAHAEHHMDSVRHLAAQLMARVVAAAVQLEKEVEVEALAALLARWCWAHAEHHMDSVRHLAAQLMARVVAAAVQLEKEVEVEALAALLARWCWAHAEHHMDSVRHLAAQLMARVVAAAAQLEKEVEVEALAALLARWCWAHAEHHMDSVRHLAAQLMARVVAAAVQLEKEVEVEALAALLARWCWAHAEHHMDSVRHLAAQLMARVVAAAVQLEKEVEVEALAALLARWCWAHAEHHMDSVRHLAAQLMARVVAAAVQLEKEVEVEALAALLARWCWAHAEHHMDSVRHLAAQLMARVVAAAVQLEKEVEVEALAALLARWCWAHAEHHMDSVRHLAAQLMARVVAAASYSQSVEVEALAALLARWCWAHAEHHMDSVRHLAAQLMARVVAAAVQLEKEGDPSTLEHLFTSLYTVDSSRKTFYVVLTALAEAAGAAVLARRPDVIRDVIHALSTQAVQACATTFLETLLKKHMQQSDPDTIYQQWISVILEAVKCESDPAVLSILEKILTKAVQWDSGVLRYILPEQRALSSYQGSDLKCILLVLGVVRKSGVPYKGVTFDDLRHCAYDADDETLILSLSLVSESPRSTQPLTDDELTFVLHFLDYNFNAQSPSFRQLVLANMKKILKRLEDSYKMLKRKPKEHSTEIAYYLNFISELRALCFASVSAGGASYGRRYIALQLLSWLGHLQLAEDRTWTEEQAEILYNLLEDSYENNKALALEVLQNCPAELIKPVHSTGYVADAITQASSVRPTDCVAASYKLLLLLSLPKEFQPYYKEHNVPSPACFGLLHKILSELREQCTRAQDILRAARDAPMYGLVHCLARLIGGLDASAIANNDRWSALVADIIATCEVVNSRVSAVVSAASPEGLLPEDTSSDSFGGTRLADGRAVTAQMLLLCAWRSVKETSLLLGSIVSRLCLEGEAPTWTLSAKQVEDIGEHLIMLLSTVKHRGAFEQAYVGFTLLLGRLWKCKSALHQLPLQWFSSIERGFVIPADGSTEYCATRRGAGLPFMIQALVTTELAAESTVPRGRLLRRCLELCLSAARSPPGPAAAARAHLVLRALYRHTAPPAAHTAEAIMVAVRGFEADTWTERNSSTLLFSALTVRVFGVARSSGHKLSARNTMTGRIFFLRYPQLYDFLLDQLKSVSPDSTLRPSLFPTLLLLARLYPSALEGTVSNLKTIKKIFLLVLALNTFLNSFGFLVSTLYRQDRSRLLQKCELDYCTCVQLECFLPHLVALAGARDAGTRRLAARAAAPLLPPHRCIAHMQSLLVTLGDPKIKRNLCHGLLCQLTVLLELKPDVTIDENSRPTLLAAVRETFWIPKHLADDAPCFLIADEWLEFINLILLRFPKLLNDDLPSMSSLLETVLFSPAPTITSGREAFLTNATYLSLIISNVPALLTKRCLQHSDYEVNLAALNYLLILHGYEEDSSPFLDHLSKILNKETLEELERDINYVGILCKVTKNGYLECKQKALKVLALTKDTQREIVKLKLGNNVELTEETVIMELIDSIRNGHTSLSSIYLLSLLSFVSKPVLEVVRVLYECSSAGNEEDTREIVVGYLEKHLMTLVKAKMSANKAEMFEWSALLFATVAILLEDDSPAVRQRAANAVLTSLHHKEACQQSTSPLASQQWRRAAAGARAAPALQLLLAGLDFCAHVHTGDELGEECRVFDQNETHNVYLEEFIWTRDCALELKRIYRQTDTNHTIQEYIHALLTNPDYKETIRKLCIDNVAEYLMGQMKTNNPKIILFLKILYE